jgi:hypothetical protein
VLFEIAEIGELVQRSLDRLLVTIDFRHNIADLELLAVILPSSACHRSLALGGYLISSYTSCSISA